MSLGWRHGLAMPFVAAAGAVRHMAAWGLPWRACPLGLSEIASRSLLLDRPQIALSMLRALALRLREVEQRVDAWMAS
jgi:hypothetical protein